MKAILIISILLFAFAIAEMLFYKPNLELRTLQQTARADSLQQECKFLKYIEFLQLSPDSSSWVFYEQDTLFCIRTGKWYLVNNMPKWVRK